MSETRARLFRCIAAAFPTLSESEIEGSNLTALLDIDSLAGVTLVSLIGEEFGVNLDFEELADLGSFDAFEQFLSKPASGAIAGE